MYIERDMSKFKQKQIIIPIETSKKEVNNIIMEQIGEGFFLSKRYDYNLDYDILVFSNNTKSLLIPVEYTEEQVIGELKEYLDNGYLPVFVDFYDMDYFHYILVK